MPGDARFSCLNAAVLLLELFSAIWWSKTAPQKMPMAGSGRQDHEALEGWRSNWHIFLLLGHRLDYQKAPVWHDMIGGYSFCIAHIYIYILYRWIYHYVIYICHLSAQKNMCISLIIWDIECSMFWNCLGSVRISRRTGRFICENALREGSCESFIQNSLHQKGFPYVSIGLWEEFDKKKKAFGAAPKDGNGSIELSKKWVRREDGFCLVGGSMLSRAEENVIGPLPTWIRVRSRKMKQAQQLSRCSVEKLVDWWCFIPNGA